jgi:hypothetical protein
VFGPHFGHLRTAGADARAFALLAAILQLHGEWIQRRLFGWGLDPLAAVEAELEDLLQANGADEAATIFDLRTTNEAACS